MLDKLHYYDLQDKCVAERLPPLLPAKVKDLLTHEKKFTSKGDVEVVAKLYRTFFEAVTRTTEELV